MDQMYSALTQISEILLKLQKRLAESSVTDERSRLSMEQTLSNIRQQQPTFKYAVPLRNQKFSEVLSVNRYRLLNQSLMMNPEDVEKLTRLDSQLRPRMDGLYSIKSRR